MKPAFHPSRSAAAFALLALGAAPAFAASDTLLAQAAPASSMAAPMKGSAMKPGRMSGADRAFMLKAASGGLYEVEVSKLAAGKAESADVKKYASMLVDDHTKANAELTALAEARGVKLPAQPPADKRERLTRMGTMSGAAFDQAYVKQVGIGDHKADIALFEKAGRTGKDPEIKAWIDGRLPTLREHLAAAQKQNVADPAGRPVTGSERSPMNAAPAKPDMHPMQPMQPMKK